VKTDEAIYIDLIMNFIKSSLSKTMNIHI